MRITLWVTLISTLQYCYFSFLRGSMYICHNNGEYGCVGCGRCLQKCPISMNIVKVMKTLGGEK